MKYSRIFVSALLVLAATSLSARHQNFVLSGTVVDSISADPLRNVYIFCASENSDQRAMSNHRGNFRLVFDNPQSLRLKFSRYGYEPSQLNFRMTRDTTIIVKLRRQPIQMPEIEISADARHDRLRQMRQETQATAVFDLSSLEKLPAADVADIIAFSPGAYIKDYGGMGGLKTVSLRGTAAEQTPILIDGVRFDSFQTGITDLSMLALGAFSEITVKRSGDAAADGESSVGGAVYLQTLPVFSDGFTSLEAGFGAFGQASRNVKIYRMTNDWRWQFAWENDRARGDHLYQANAFGENFIARRENGDFNRHNLLAAVEKKGGKHATRFSAMLARNVRGVPGPVVQGNPGNSEARQRDFDALTIFYHRRQLNPETTFFTRLKYRYTRLRYTDPLLILRQGGVDDSYRNQDALAAIELRRIAAFGLLQGNVSAGFAKLHGDNLARTADEGFERITGVQRAFFKSSLQWRGYFGKADSSDAAIRISLAGRFNHYSDFGSVLSPSLGLNWRPTASKFHLRLHAAHNFRTPTFSEQFYLNFGNREIAPEKSWSSDFGFNYETGLRGRLLLQSSIFLIATQNKIVAIPLSPVRWSARNVGAARQNGFETNVIWESRNDRLAINAAYTRQIAQDRTPNSRTRGKQIIYIPREIFTAVTTLQQPIFRSFTLIFGSAVRRVSFRYHLPENDLRSLMPGYLTIDGYAELSAKIANAEWRLRLETENLTNTSYEVIKNYPMPLRLWRIKLKTTF